ncbi:hypothetical protein fugu_014947 [Takifugu bimaculatus]|uniref:IMD domain-containing protein n=1 Tax=Takifugu bimaculatus TaxID=433685 RepID=A0A4Z2BX84_9TELE|nr:hypothetical protein fugu_014947 [Takifugu bimaculatus]
MVLAEDFTMSRTDEVNRLTENVYKTIMEQFNPCLRNFVAMGKNYEKALASVTFAAKGYFDALVRMGELASESQGSKDLGDVLFQMAEVHRQIQVQLEEMLKSFHNELLSELEKKVELDARYLTAALKKYQVEHKSKGESLEKCQAELKKLRRKSQGSKNPSKYGEKEMQFVETISSKQTELDTFIAEGYKTALSEERRRYCFLVDRQCAVAKNSSAYHGKGKDLLTQKIPVWQQACSDPNKLPERAMLLAQQMGSAAIAGTSPLHTSKSNLVISDPIPGATPLPVPPELAVFMGSGLGHPSRLIGPDGMSMVNGTTGVHGEEYWTDGGTLSQVRPSSPQTQGQAQAQPQKQVSDVYSNTLPVRRPAPAKNKNPVGETRTLPRSSSMAAGLEKNGRSRVQAIFSHAAWRQRHPAELLRGRRHHPARARSPRRLALRRERKEQDARLVPLLLHARPARERQREAQSEPASREKQQHGEPAGERRLAAHARLRPDRPSAGPESCTDPPTSLQHGRLWYTERY